MVIFGYLNNSKSGGFRRYVVNDENTFLHPPEKHPFLTPRTKTAFFAFLAKQPKIDFFKFSDARKQVSVETRLVDCGIST